ncbi:MAG: CapA family protein [Rhodospirillales bacterium]|nr:CapA family protein [Rhodospirillales bacterium]
MTDLSLFLCGDVMLGRGIDQILRVPGKPKLFEAHATSALRYVQLAEELHGPIPRHVPPEYVWGDALAAMAQEKPALRIVNLETAVTTASRPWPKGINYRMHPGNVDCLTAARINCCVVANNHVLDWGREGLVETLDSLRRAGIRESGAGHDATEAAAPAMLAVPGGGRLLVFGFAATSSGVPQAWAAGSTTPGVNLLPDLSTDRAACLAGSARRLRCPGDLLMASIHWGGNWGYAIEAGQRAFAHALIDGGFDLVHGHSSHHPKALEVHRGRLVLYGCGDFINDYEGIAGYERFRGDLSLMYFPRLDAATGALRALRMVPVQISRFRLRRPSAGDAAWLYDVISRESHGLDTRLAPCGDGSFAIEGAAA